MKHMILAALLFLSAIPFAQGLPTPSDSYDLLINGQTFKSGDTIRTEDLKKLPDLLLLNVKTKQQYKPRDFEWVISLEGEISKNQALNQDNWRRLPDLLSRIDKNSLVFIDNIKLDLPHKGVMPTYNLVPK